MPRINIGMKSGYEEELMYLMHRLTAWLNPDHYIEKVCNMRMERVATSDGQVIIRGAGCLLYSAREFEKEVKAMEEHIRSDYLNRTY